jgi:hypothetical protein
MNKSKVLQPGELGGQISFDKCFSGWPSASLGDLSLWAREAF